MARSFAAGEARLRASRSNGRRSPTSGSQVGTSASLGCSRKAHFAASARCSISSPTAKAVRTVTYALEWEPLSVVGRVFGARLAEQAGEAVGKRTLEAVAFARGLERNDQPFDLPPPELPEAHASGPWRLPARSTAALTATGSAHGSPTSC